MKKIYRIAGLFTDVYEDDYEQGELGHVNNWTGPDILHSLMYHEFESIADILKMLNDKYLYIWKDADNIKNWVIFEDPDLKDEIRFDCDTMVDVDEQYNQQMVNAGNYVRNFMGIFVLIALYSAIFKKKNWRDFSLIGAFVIAYLGIISTSGFANSERFLLPGFPILLMIAAYGITQLDAKNYRFVKIWFLILPVMIMAWAFFKLGSRGLS